MSSEFIKPPAASRKPKHLQKPNNVRWMLDRMRQRDRQLAETAAQEAAAVASQTAASLVAPGRPQCPNKSCPKPNVVDGVCQTCGRVADDSNIVAEVQFGETSAGAAVPQGSYVAADQAGARMTGPGFRRVGGIRQEMERSLREVRSMITGWAQQLHLSATAVDRGVNCFKMTQDHNFVQGRTLVSVAAVCLYAACRTDPPCKIMLIDLADLTRVNVFKLGRIFKALRTTIHLDTPPVFPEDLIFRFAVRLEFGHMTQKVAEDAVRLVRRMSQDWISMGRRPAGICGACLLMAARLNNFRRTVREIVYIVKVTTATITSRLEDFNQTQSSQMTVEDFLQQDFLESSHDPPSFYQKSDEYRQTMMKKSRKRKRRVTDHPDGGDNDGSVAADKQSQTPETDVAEIGAGAGAPVSPSTSQAGSARAAAETSAEPAEPYRRDADGFLIPRIPTENALDDGNSDFSIEAALRLGDVIERAVAATPELPPASNDLTPERRTRRARERPPIDEAWEEDEQDLELEITAMVHDVEAGEVGRAATDAEERARSLAAVSRRFNPPKDVSESETVAEDEFADDLEVQNCLLTPDEVAIKESIWVNNNKDWLRAQQEKVFRQMTERDRPKATRNRKKKPRIGEGQTSPASSPAEAAIRTAKERGFSRRINYDAIRQIFEDDESIARPGSASGSAGPSRLGSVFNPEDSPDRDVDEQDEDDESNGEYEDGGDGEGFPDYDDNESEGYDDDL